MEESWVVVVVVVEELVVVVMMGGDDGGCGSDWWLRCWEMEGRRWGWVASVVGWWMGW